MKKAIKASKYFREKDCDLLVIPFIGGTASGDATATTLDNTMHNTFYEILYFA